MADVMYFMGIGRLGSVCIWVITHRSSRRPYASARSMMGGTPAGSLGPRPTKTRASLCSPSSSDSASNSSRAMVNSSTAFVLLAILGVAAEGWCWANESLALPLPWLGKLLPDCSMLFRSSSDECWLVLFFLLVSFWLAVCQYSIYD